MKPVSRRVLLASISALPVLLSSSAHAQLSLLGYAEALGKAADLIKQLSANLVEATKNGFKEWDIVAARLQREKYLELTRRLSKLFAVQNVEIIASFSSYISYWQRHRPLNDPARRRLTSSWADIQNNAQNVLSYVRDLSQELEKIKGLFVANDTYRGLLATLSGRGALLAELAAIPAPLEETDIRDLGEVAKEYEKLHVSLGEFITALSDYIAHS